MSLAQALALVSARRKNNANTAPSGPQKRGYPAADAHDELFTAAINKIDEVAVVNFPNITIYGGDYNGNILGCRICPPLESNSNRSDDDSDDNDDDDNDGSDLEHNNSKKNTTAKKPVQDKSRLNALARALAREKGIDPALLEQKKQLKYSLNLRPVVSGELHAGSVGSIASFNRYVVTAGLQDESIKLSKRDVNQTINKLKEFGSLHRHDSTITATVFTPSNHGQLCLSGAENGIIFVWSPLNQWDCIGVLRSHTARIVAITPHPTANMALSLSLDNRLVMWDLRPESFKPVFTTQLRLVKPSWGTQALPPLNMIFSTDGNYYSVLYNRCVHTYHTTGEHAGKIMSIINIPSDITTLWSSIQYLDPTHIILGNEKGDMYIFNAISAEQITHLTGHHKYRVKQILTIPQVHTTWITQFTTPLHPTPVVTPAQSQTKKSTSTPLKKQKQQALDDSEPVETLFIVSADSDGKIVLWQIEVKVTGAQTIQIQPKAPKNDDVINIDDIDQEPNAENEDGAKPKFSYPILTTIASIKGKSVAHLAANTRITCLCLALPFDPSHLNPLGNQYKEMGHVMETTNESTTQYEDVTDALYRKQQVEYAKKYKQQKVDDFKLKVRDYHRMKAGKIKSLAEGDAVKRTSAGEKGPGKDKYRKMDEEFQKEHQKRQTEKQSSKTGGAASKGAARLNSKAARRANPALAGTLRARERTGGKKGGSKGGAKTRGKRRF